MRVSPEHRRGPWRRHDRQHHGRPGFAGHDLEFHPREFHPEDPMTPPFPQVPPFGFGRHGHGPGRGVRGHGGPRGGGRQRRGDVRAALLALLTERPMHGYEMIQEIAARSGGFWKPSPGSVYPTLQLLADEGLVRGVDGEGGKRLFELTEDGAATAARQDGAPPWEQVTADVDPTEVDLRTAMGQLASAAMTVSQAASPQQKARAVDILNEARRALYALLGEANTASDD
ncbi:PadR family transcriptional regulator [Actinokineospora iranica]|uniref:DNA-binding transcriptional regulator, PadR family n=1 Tax=Actinokineospora iranica TaxID=1271860 RepID=A0A1G6NE48_9PSEU|nr:PadR family transcriptional regulator [Actinokineospora iranica]SDC66120.1 DNA-binding transcriptional regulator, PadR family [Actinokineospora iranica]